MATHVSPGSIPVAPALLPFNAAPSELPDLQQYRLLADSIPNLAWIAHADGAIFWFNRRWYEYTGTSYSAMQGWGWQSVHDPVRLPQVLQHWKASVGTGEPFEMTFPLRAADGTFRPFLTRVVPLKSPDGTILRWFGTNTDVGEQMETAAALRESEQRFRTATQAVNGILWTNTAQGEMRSEQPAWSAFTGQTPEQYSGYGWASAVHPEDAQPTIDAWQIAVRESRLFAFEHRVRRHDGIYRLCSIRALPVRNDDGSIREWVGIHTDITEDRERQQVLRDTIVALRGQEEMIEAAQIANNVGFWRYQRGAEHIFLSSGLRHLLGLPVQGEASFAEALARVHPEDVALIENALAVAFETGRYMVEFRALTDVPGAFRWMRSVASVQHKEGQAPYLVGMNLDTTEQKRTADALVRTEKLAAMGRLASSIAHEINNPLEAVTNIVYLLLQSPLDEEQKSFCLTMMAELRRVSAIATHTLRFHRQSTSASRTPLNTLVDSVLTLFEGKIRNAGITVECRTPAEHFIHGFDGELRQVLANLVGNAVDAISGTQSSRRTLFIRTHSGHHPRTGVPGLTVTVADTGTGIAPSSLARIFDPFFTTKGDTGTGLGLWVSTEIVNKHGGTIQVRTSENPTLHGTVFRVLLPHTA